MNIIEALKERLGKEKYCRGSNFGQAVDICIQALDSFQSERNWHDPAEKLPEDGEEVWAWCGNSNGLRYARPIRGLYIAPDFFCETSETTFDVLDVTRWTPRYVDTPPPTPEEG